MTVETQNHSENTANDGVDQALLKREPEPQDGPCKHVNEVTEPLTEKELEVRLAKTMEPPDGGWGWMIVFCSFMIHLILDGITYSFGVIFVALLEDFQGGKGDTAWILSIFVGITLATGPIASALVNQYNCRTVCIIGAIIGAIGFLISPFAPDIWFLYISIGLIGGFGFGLVYLPAIVIVSYYFEKRRALATGLACCGSGFGTFVFAPFSAMLVEEFGWKQTCFWLAAIILQCCIFGALLRPLPLIDNTESLDAPAKPHPSVQLNNKSLSESHMLKTDTKPKPSASHTRSKLSLHVTSISSLNHQPLHGHQLKQHIPLHRKDVFYSGSLHNIPLYNQNRTDYITSNMSLAHSLHQAKGTTQPPEVPPTACQAIASVFKSFIDVSLLKDWGFVLFLVSNIFTNLGFNAPYIFIPDRAIEYGINPKRAAFLLSILGIANTIGRIAFGYVADTKYIKPYRIHLYSSGLVVAGISTAVSSIPTYTAQAIYSATYGASIGGYVSLTAVILVDLLGVERLTSSFGITLLVQGMFVLIGPPICGWLYDATSSYTWSFVVIGASVALSGVMLYFLPLVSRLQHRQRPQREVDLGVRIGVSDIQEVSDEEVTLRSCGNVESNGNMLNIKV